MGYVIIKGHEPWNQRNVCSDNPFWNLSECQRKELFTNEDAFYFSKGIVAGLEFILTQKRTFIPQIQGEVRTIEDINARIKNINFHIQRVISCHDYEAA